MKCNKCATILVPTGIMCLCGHEQFACPGCRHIWSHDHKKHGGYEIDWNSEKKISEMIKKNYEKFQVRTLEAYIDKMVPIWKKNSNLNR